MMGMLLAWMVFLAAQDHPAAPGHWPQWRGPDRTNISRETGLLKTWPEGGPPLLWKTDGLGKGVGSVAVAGGRIYVIGNRDDSEWVTALDGSGKKLWSTKLGPPVGRVNSLMQWVSQRTVTVDGNRVYVLGGNGTFLCLRSVDGRKVWGCHYTRTFRGTVGTWGEYCDYPLVDGDVLILTPGGPTATMVGLNKLTGERLWVCPVRESKRVTFSETIACTIAGERQYVNQLDAGIVGVSATDGKKRWFYPRPARIGTNTHHTWALPDGRILATASYNQGSVILSFQRKAGSIEVVEDASLSHRTSPFLGGSFVIDGHLYCTSSGGSVTCHDLATLERKEFTGLFRGPHAMTRADGLYYVRGRSGPVALVRITPEGLELLSSFDLPRGEGKEGVTWTLPVVAGGRLYLRDQEDLYCYDVRGADFKDPAPPIKEPLAGPDPGPRKRNPGTPDKPKPSAVFVPTPGDVVARMLELAGVKKDDVVVDLGSGDGRIPIAAAKKYGCRGAGVEIDADLVALSRKVAADAGVQDLVTIRQGDLFKADLSEATVVTLYLGEDNNRRLVPALRKLKDGVRIVSHAHTLGVSGLTPDRTVTVTSGEDDAEHVLHLWTTPLKEKQ